MSSPFWNNFLNKLPGFLLTTSTLCIGADLLMNSRCCHRRPSWIFPMRMPYPFFPLYSSPRLPAMTPSNQYQEQSGISQSGAVSSSQPQNLGQNFVTADETQFVSDSWKTLDAKPNKTNAEQLQLLGKYRNFAANLAKSFISFIDNSQSGDKDGYISKEEFQQYYLSQMQPESTDSDTITKLKSDADKIFESLDLTGEGKLDWKELSAFMSLADKSGENGQYDGTIKKDESLNTLKVILENGSTAKTQLEENYSNLFNTLS